MTQLGL